MPERAGSELDLYRVLEIGRNASSVEVQSAFDRIMQYLGPESLALYSVLDDTELAAQRAQVQEAYRVLSDPELRDAYDHKRGEGDESYPSVILPDLSNDATMTMGRMARASSKTEPPRRGQRALQTQLPLGLGDNAGRSMSAPEPVASTDTSVPDALLKETDEAAIGTLAKHTEPVPPAALPVEEPQRSVSSLRPMATPPSVAQRDRYAPAPSDVIPELASGPVLTKAQATESLDSGFRRNDEAEARRFRSHPTPPPELIAAPPAPAIPRPFAATTLDVQAAVAAAPSPAQPRTSPVAASPRKPAKPVAAGQRLQVTQALPELAPDSELSGAVFRRLRESASASLEDVSRITKVGLRHLRAIEDNDLSALPAPVYVRGFVREYARVLGLEVETATRAYMRAYERHRSAT